eukprot:2211477-Rhodomonas_salina.1
MSQRFAPHKHTHEISRSLVTNQVVAQPKMSQSLTLSQNPSKQLRPLRTNFVAAQLEMNQ